MTAFIVVNAGLTGCIVYDFVDYARGALRGTQYLLLPRIL